MKEMLGLWLALERRVFSACANVIYEEKLRTWPKKYLFHYVLQFDVWKKYNFMIELGVSALALITSLFYNF